MTKPKKWHVRPVKTQISLGICPVWSESWLSAWRKLGSLATHWVHSKDYSDWADAQADRSLLGGHAILSWGRSDLEKIPPGFIMSKSTSIKIMYQFLSIGTRILIIILRWYMMSHNIMTIIHSWKYTFQNVRWTWTPEKFMSHMLLVYENL